MSRDPALLLDMLVAARKVRLFNTGLTRDQFARDELRQSATRYQLQIVGEAAWKVSDEFRAKHPEIPRGKISGLRHRLVDEYSAIDPDKIWSVVERHIDELISSLEPLIPADE